MPIRHVTSQSKLDKIIDKYEKVVIKFSGNFCTPCKQIAPLYKSLSDTYTEAVFVEIDVEKADQSINQQYKVSGIPLFVSIKNGNVVDHFTGANQDKLKQMISTL